MGNPGLWRFTLEELEEARAEARAEALALALLEKLIRHMEGEWFKCKSPATLEELQYGVEEMIECTLSTPECMPIWQQVTRNETIEECAKALEDRLFRVDDVEKILRAMKKPIQTDHLS